VQLRWFISSPIQLAFIEKVDGEIMMMFRRNRLKALGDATVFAGGGQFQTAEYCYREFKNGFSCTTIDT
jgi:hypothetical protein